MFLTSLKQICNEYLIKFSENQSAPKLENRKTSPCSPCAPNLLHVLLSRTTGYHNLCSPGCWGMKMQIILVFHSLASNWNCLATARPRASLLISCWQGLSSYFSRSTYLLDPLRLLQISFEVAKHIYFWCKVDMKQQVLSVVS